MSAIKPEKEKGVSIQAVVRCRPLNDEEKRLNLPQALSCNDARREVTLYQNIAASSKLSERVFTFDRVFGPNSKQSDVYDHSISHIVDEVLDGFNCTVFAYGQTGTGKTYTMEGIGKPSRAGGLPPEAGVIPRAVKQIFETLDSQNSEYSIKVSFLELYNEELTDLLAPEDIRDISVDEKPRKALTLLEEVKTGGIIVRGLEETLVNSAMDIYHLLDRGTARRRTAETLLNKQSSRSHCILTISLFIKETTAEGIEMMKSGKLNLVDLAGAENISRSGAREERAREAGEINKSLLTLGRVITALAEHQGHVPYRESKLTRLLRDSLGGKTKTCIIATVSPSVICKEETSSTLEYAHRAKNIKNRPEINQRTTKTALLRELTSEIEKLRSELFAQRKKSGVYVPKEIYEKDDFERKLLTARVTNLEEELFAANKVIEKGQEEYSSLIQRHTDLQDMVQNVEDELAVTRSSLANSFKENEELKSAMKKEKEEHAAAVQKIAELEQNLQSTVAVLSATKSSLSHSLREGENLRSALKREQAEHSEALKTLASTEQTLRNTESDLSATRTSLSLSLREGEGLRAALKREQEEHSNALQMLASTEGTLRYTEGELSSTRASLANALREGEELRFVIKCREETEKSLVDHALFLRGNFHEAAVDISGLHAKIESQSVVDSRNKQSGQVMKSSIERQVDDLKTRVQGVVKSQLDHSEAVNASLTNLTEQQKQDMERLKSELDALKNAIVKGAESAEEFAEKHTSITVASLAAMDEKERVHETALVKNLADTLASAMESLENIQKLFSEQQEEVQSFAQQQKQFATGSLQICVAFADNLAAALTKIVDDLDKCSGQLTLSLISQESKMSKFVEEFEESSKKNQEELLVAVKQYVTAICSQQTEKVAAEMAKLRASVSESSSSARNVLSTVRSSAVESTEDCGGFKSAAQKLSSDVTVSVTEKQKQLQQINANGVERVSELKTQWEQSSSLTKEERKSHAAEIVGALNTVVESSKEAMEEVRGKSEAFKAESEAGFTSVLSLLDESRGSVSERAVEVGGSVQAMAAKTQEFETEHAELALRIPSRVDSYLSVDLIDDKTAFPRKREIRVPGESETHELKSQSMEALIEEHRRSTKPESVGA